jgi:hypothetical protein
MRVMRERLGLPTRWVADTLDVAERSVHRWEAGTAPIPDEIARLLLAWTRHAQAAVDEWVDRVATQIAAQGAPVELTTYRTDVDFDAAQRDTLWPASWHRAIAGRVLERLPDLVVVEYD